MDEASKARQAISLENYRGFIPLRFFTPNRNSNAVDGAALKPMLSRATSFTGSAPGKSSQERVRPVRTEPVA
ncbi:MAG: hypothetical protein CM1200mP26_28900 [Acidimicrobiales bacterium]|nr:MAG: hypothetical protein CM1200mP26_28900 [Acidimicrobiales bacterium]